MRRVLVIVVVLAVSFGAIACQKLGGDRSVPTLDHVPAAYGQLVGVVPFAPQPTWAVLWFQARDKTIHAVRVNLSTGKVLENSLTISRK